MAATSYILGLSLLLLLLTAGFTRADLNGDDEEEEDESDSGTETVETEYTDNLAQDDNDESDEFVEDDTAGTLEDYAGEAAEKSGYGHEPKPKKVYVPVYVPEKEKKKMKIISVDKGFYIPGGTQLPGKFKSLKHCMKACAETPTCYSADYNPWLHKCYTHSNLTACNQISSHPQFIHFNKVPCKITDAPDGRISLGASMAYGVEQKGIDSLQQCIKKCVNAGGGVPASIAAGNNAADARQACYAIDYDFSNHKCYFFGYNILSFRSGTIVAFFAHCPTLVSSTTTLVNNPCSLGCVANPTVVHMTFCPNVV